MEAQLISEQEKEKLEILCDFLLYGSNGEFADYNRFKTCFEYLFKRDEKWFENVYDYLVGVFKGTNKKRKYLSFTRLYQAYLDFKIKKNGQNVKEDISLFFEKLMNSIIKTPDDNNIVSISKDKNIEKSEEVKNVKEYKFTSREYKNEIFYISRLVVLCNKSHNIVGIKLEYNNNIEYRVKMYKEKELYQALNLRLEKNENDYINDDNNEIIDSITHIFGTFNETITFIGFKFSSGKINYFGRPEGDSFLFGSFEKKVQYLNLNIDKNGITKLEAFYTGNKIVNKYIKFKENEIDKIFKDEEDLMKKDDDNYELLRRTEISNARKSDKNTFIGENINYNPTFAYLIEKNSKEENDEHVTTIKKKNINKYYMLKPNPFLKMVANDIFIPNPFFPEEVKKKKEEFKRLQISVNLEETRNNLKFSNYNNIFANKISKSLILNERREKLLKDLEAKRNFVKIKEKVKNNIYQNFLKLFKNKMQKDIQIALNHIMKEKEEEDNKKNKIKEEIEEENEEENEEEEKNEDNDQKEKKPDNEDVEAINYLAEKVNLNGNEFKKEINDLKENENNPIERKITIDEQDIKYFEEQLNKINKKQEDKKEEEEKEAEKVEEKKVEEEKKFEEDKKKEEEKKVQEEEIEKNENKENFSKLIKNIILLKKLKRFKIKKIPEEIKNEVEEKESNVIENESVLNNNENENVIKRDEDDDDDDENNNDKDLNDINNEDNNIDNNIDNNEKEQRNYIDGFEFVEKEKENVLIKSFYSNLSKINKVYKEQQLPKKLRVWKDKMFDEEKALGKKHKKIFWLRPEEANNKNYFIIKDKPEMQYIRQSKNDVNDCYFLAALGALCEKCNSEKFKNNDVIQNLFYITEKTKEKAYGIFFFIDGVRHLVLIDDFFAYYKHKKKYKLFYSDSTFITQELWVSLIEKAWAKLNGGYINIKGGIPATVFEALTGAFTRRYFLKYYEIETIEKILKDSKDYLICAGTKDLDFFINFVLKEYHQYTVVKIENKIIELRDPFGKIIIISLNKFYQYFFVIDVNYFKPNLFVSPINISKEEAKESQIIQIKNDEENDIYINLYLKKEISSYFMLIKKEENEKYSFIKAITSINDDGGFDKHVGIEKKNLEKGIYYIYCDTIFKSNKSNNGYLLNIYSIKNRKLELENITKKLSSNEKIKIFHETIKNYIFEFYPKYYKNDDITKFTKKNIDVTQVNNWNHFPFEIFHLKNKNNKEVKIEIKILKEPKEYYYLYNDDGKGKTERTINSEQLICVTKQKYNDKDLLECKLIGKEKEILFKKIK